MLIICFSDYWHNKEYLQIDALEEQPQKTTEKKSPIQIKRLLKCNIDGITFHYWYRELVHFHEFRCILRRHPALHGVNVLRLQIVPPSNLGFDWLWSRMLSHKIWERIEIEHMMSWLSTLGGGFSALGDSFTNCAQVAGKISMQQLNLGMRLGDPYLQSRCKLFYSISLIQVGHLRAAKYIIRQQYCFAIRERDKDIRLLRMCKGIWLRLQYEYLQRQLRDPNKSSEQMLTTGADR